MNYNIAFYHKKFPLGGAEKVTLDTAQYLRNKGNHIYIFCKNFAKEKLPESEFSNYTEDENVVILRKGKDKSIIANCLAKKIDFLIIQGSRHIDVRKLKLALSHTKIIYCNHGSPFWEITNKIECKRYRKNNSFGNLLLYYLIDAPKIFCGIYERRFMKIYHKIYTFSDAYVTLCEAYSEEIRTRLRLQNPDKLYAINNPEKIADANLDKEKIVLYVGRLTYADKRVDRLLSIWHKAGSATTGWKLIIVGDGKEKKRLEQQAESLNLANVFFAGFCNSPQKYYDRAAVLCLTSTFEGWGLVLTEAQTNGVIPIAFGCTEGVKTILAPNGENGICIEPFDLDAYAKELTSLLLDENRRRHIQQNVLVKRLEYSPEKTGEKWIALLDTLAEKR